MHVSKALKQRSGAYLGRGQITLCLWQPPWRALRIISGGISDGEGPSYHWKTVPRLRGWDRPWFSPGVDAKAGSNEIAGSSIANRPRLNSSAFSGGLFNCLTRTFARGLGGCYRLRSFSGENLFIQGRRWQKYLFGKVIQCSAWCLSR
jgi:hypothetical protein